MSKSLSKNIRAAFFGGRYPVIRTVMTVLSAAALFLPFAKAVVRLPYYEQSLTLGAGIVGSLQKSGLWSIAGDVLNAGAAQTEIRLLAAVAVLYACTALCVFIGVVFWIIGAADNRLSVKLQTVSSIAALGCCALGAGLLFIAAGLAKKTAFLTVSPCPGLFVLIVLLVLLTGCLVFIKKDTARLQAESASKTGKKALAVALCAAVLIAGGVICGVVFSGRSQPAEAPVPPAGTDEVYVDMLPGTAQDAYALIQEKINQVRYEKRQQIDGTRSLSVDGIQGTFTDAQRNVLGFLFPRMLAQISGAFPRVLIDYGEETAVVLPDLAEAGVPKDFTAELTADGMYAITLVYDAKGAASLYTTAPDEVLADAKTQFEKIVEVRSVASAASAAEVYAVINEINGVLSELEIRTTYNVSMDCLFSGDFGSLGEKTAAFQLTDALTYSVKRQGVYIAANVLTMSPGETLSLPVTFNLPASFTPEDYRVTYSTFNPDVVSVDENGVVTAKAETETPVTVTVLLELTNTTGVFYDNCEIIVKAP